MWLPEKPSWVQWSHNEHYHGFLLRQMPGQCETALDVGCGAGRFATRVAERACRVVAIDRDSAMIDTAQAVSPHPRLRYISGDLFDADLAGGFDFISCIAALHHMPFGPALHRLRGLLRPGGVLAVLGLYRLATPVDYLQYAAMVPVDLAVGVVRHRRDRATRVPPAPLAPSSMTLAEIRARSAQLLPGCVVRRRLYARYSLLYRCLSGTGG